MNQPNKFAPPQSPIDLAMPAKARTAGTYVLAGLIFLQTLAMAMYGSLLFELVRTGAVNVLSGMGIVLAWALLLVGGLRLVMGRGQPKYTFAVSAVLGLVLLPKMPALFAVTGVVLAGVAFVASFMKAKPSGLRREPTGV